jgi:copper chaperone CopZ
MTHWRRLTIILSNLLAVLLLTSVALAEDVQRTSYFVNNFSCSSCLENIEAKLKSLPGTIGMNADVQRGRITVDHRPDLSYERITSAITDIGYPATVEWTATVPEQNIKRSSQERKYSARCGGGNCGVSSTATSKRSCNATSASWKKLYTRYFSQTNSK